MHHQNTRANLWRPQLSSDDDRRLASSFIGMAAALRSRPTPRGKWDEVAAGRAHFKGRDAVLCGQEVMRDAIATGDLAIIEQSAERVACHFDHMKLAALRAYHGIVSGRVTLRAARAKASKETTEALHCIVLSVDGEADPQQLAKEITEAIEALCDYRAQVVAPRRPVNDRPRLVRT